MEVWTLKHNRSECVWVCACVRVSVCVCVCVTWSCPLRYTLVLEARDRGSPTRIGQTTLVVRVLDINDNAPRFDSSFFSIMIREGIT